MSRITRVGVMGALVAFLLGLMAVPAFAQEAMDVHVETTVTFYLLCMVLVFLMHPGFAMLEAGMTGANNASNIMVKNMMTLTVGFLMYFLIGWGLMYGSSLGGLVGTDQLFLFGGYGAETVSYPFLGSEFMFDAVFAATAATIVSGALAGRVKLVGFVILAAVLTGVVYPIVGHWSWADGWLANLGFHDFAGSTVVHLTGGAAALAAAWVLGPRAGKFAADGTPRSTPGHSSPLAFLGVFLLFGGWFGFNGGSVLPAIDEIDGSLFLSVGPVLLTTALAASAGALAALVFSAIRNGGRTDVGMIGNGVLAGLVGITAGADVMTPLAAIAVGIAAGVLVSLVVPAVEKLGIDDAVGAFAVHGACGVLGTVWVGLFSTADGLVYGGSITFLGVQIIGPLAVALFVGGVTWAVCTGLKAANLLRVEEEALESGLDLHEHLGSAYPDNLGYAAHDNGIPAGQQ